MNNGETARAFFFIFTADDLFLSFSLFERVWGGKKMKKKKKLGELQIWT